MSRTDSILLGFLSLIVAVLLWLQVETQTEPSKQREISIPLEMRNLPSELVATRYPSNVTIIAEGPPDALDKLNTKQISAFVDLSRAKKGIHPYGVQINAPTRMPTTLALRNPKEMIDISGVVKEDLPVTIDERGRPPQGLEYDGASAQPNMVTIYAPESLMSSVEKVRAMIDLSKLQPGTPIETVIEILGKNNQPVPFARAEPSIVRIFPAIASAPAVNRVLVTPMWKGQPAFGFQVASYSIRPSMLQITGRPAVIGKIAKIDTEPIDIEGLRQTHTISAKLKLPSGVKASISSVTVTLQIVPAVLPSPAGPAGGVGNQ